MKFHRVVLDESQAFKNYKSHLSQACCALEAKHYWTLSGTPVMNNLQEFYPYFKFLHVPDTGSFEVFKRNYFNTANRDQCLQRLRFQLSEWTQTKTRSDNFMGAKLLPLPKAKEDIKPINMTALESKIYNIVDSRLKKKLDAGEIKDRFCRHLRLRQLTAHPLLIHECVSDVLEPEDFAELDKILTEHDRLNKQEGAAIMHLRAVLSKRNAETKCEPGDDDSSCPPEGEKIEVIPREHDGDVQKLEDIGGAYGTKNDIPLYFAQMRNMSVLKQAEKALRCPNCNKVPKEP